MLDSYESRSAIRLSVVRADGTVLYSSAFSPDAARPEEDGPLQFQDVYKRQPKGQACERLKALFQEDVQARADAADRTDRQLANVFAFLDAAIPNSQELVLFATELTANYFTSWFIQNFGCEAYFAHNKQLLFDDTRQRLLREIGSAEPD